jgi:glutaryl-CoA dehydrogenase
MATEIAPTETFLPSPQLTPREGDLFNIDAALTEEERAVRDSVRRFVDERVLPIIGKHYVDGTFPKHLIPRWGSWASSAPTCPRSTAARG